MSLFLFKYIFVMRLNIAYRRVFYVSREFYFVLDIVRTVTYNVKQEVIGLSPKNRLHMRIEEQLEFEIEELARLYEAKTGIKTTKTNITESALKEGLKVLRQNLK